MPNRKYTVANRYRYGFNGKENDPETIGTGEGSQDYGMRIYNPSLGRFLSLDPLSHSYPWFTPYQFAGNTPISAIDLDGLENVYITADINKGESMKIVYTAEDIVQIMAEQKPEFKVHYTNTGKETSQFEGPNKANEEKVFQAVKPLLIKAGITQYLVATPDHKGNDFVSIKNNYEVPAPKPIKPKLPRTRRIPIMPELSIDFVGASDKFLNETQADALIKPLADFLLKNPKINVNLTGNTGVEGNPNAPLGSGGDVLKTPAELNGKEATTGDLMKSRAEAVKSHLIKKYKIDPTRIGTSTGVQTQGAAGRTVGVSETK